MIPINIISQIIISAATIVLLGAVGFIGWWLRARWEKTQAEKAAIKERSIFSFEKLLEFHSQLFIDLTLGGWGKVSVFQDQPHLARQLCLWGSDAVVKEYGEYIIKLSKSNSEIEEHEVHFANAILAFRKDELKKKNHDLTPKHIIFIFRAGIRKEKPN